MMGPPPNDQVFDITASLPFTPFFVPLPHGEKNKNKKKKSKREMAGAKAKILTNKLCGLGM